MFVVDFIQTECVPAAPRKRGWNVQRGRVMGEEQCIADF